MNDATEAKMVDVLERLTERLEEAGETNRHSVLSVEKIVAAVITLIVTGVCIWVGSTLNSMSRQVITLNATVEYQNDTISTFVAVASKNEARLYDLEKELARLGQLRVELDAMRVLMTSVREEQISRKALTTELSAAIDRVDSRLSDLEDRISELEKRITAIRSGGSP